MSSTNTTETVPTITIHLVLAGAYKGKSVSDRALLSHASIDGGTTALCRKVKEYALCDVVEEGPATCTVCAARAARLITKGSAK